MTTLRRLARAYTLGALIMLGVFLLKLGSAVVVFAKRRLVGR